MFVAGFMFFVAAAQTIALLWAWFVAPLGAPSITLTHAVGLMALRDVAFSSTRDSEPPLLSLTFDEAAERLMRQVVAIVGSLLTGFFLKAAV